MIAQFNFPTPIRFGPGAIGELGDHLSQKDCSRPLLVTDSQIKNLDFVETKILQPLKAAGINVACYSDFAGNPIKSHVDGGVEAYREHGCDSVIILGGGAALDVGKAIALMINQPGELFDYEDGKPGALPLKGVLPFMVAIPTTAGTGSEVGRSSVISDDVTKAKKIIFAPEMLPNLVIADPELTLGLPAGITAATGIDALTHLLEAYLAKGFHPMCDGIALEGIRLVATNLVDVVKNPSNLEARQAMLMASLMGAVAFQKGLGATHSCAHALSTVYDLHHGLANALMLEACMKFNRQAVPERFDALAHLLNLESSDAFLEWIRVIVKEVGIEAGLGRYEVAITEQLLDVAQNDVCHACNPRTVSRDEFRQLFSDAM